MSDCENYQMRMDEVLALGGTPSDFPDPCTDHVARCENCSAFLEESLALAPLLEEPIPFPPVHLAEQVMERISQSERENVEAGLPWTERLVWAASGAVAMYGLDRLPEYSSNWLSEVESFFLQAEWAFATPVAMSASSLFLMALVLLLGQGALVYKARTST